MIFDNRERILENPGPICLGLTVAISGAFLHCLENKVIQDVLTTNLVRLTYKRYVHNTRARFETIQQSLQAFFQALLSAAVFPQRFCLFLVFA